MKPKIGKYEVLRKVGTGGDGAVYEAQDVLIRRSVAIKTCEAKDPEVRARFFREAQLGGSLRHRNITTVYDFGVDDGMPYIVQEFLDGEDLDRIIARPEGLALIEKLRILIGIAYGLEYAHNAGIVHGDVKPGNIRVLSDGTVKLMDFGIARLAAMGPHRTGRNMGTLAYLAPERILEQPVDARADVFSFGVVAYELLAGKRPFPGEVEEELFHNIVKSEPIALSGIAPDVPFGLASIVDRCLRKDPADRYPSIEPVRKELVLMFQSVFGRDAPLTSDGGRTAGTEGDRTIDYSSVRTPGVRDAVADTREVPMTSPAFEPEPPTALPVPAMTPSPRAADPRDAIFVARPPRMTRIAVIAVPATIAAVIIVLLLARAPRERGLRNSSAPSGPAVAVASAVTRGPSPEVPANSADPAGLAAPETSAAATGSQSSESPAVAPTPAMVETNTPREAGESAARPVRFEQVRPVTRVATSGTPRAASRETSRYARAADEPGLSADTRAAIYLSGAWEQYRAGNLASARELLGSAYAVKKELSLGPGQYDAGFRRLAEGVRARANRAS